MVGEIVEKRMASWGEDAREWANGQEQEKEWCELERARCGAEREPVRNTF